MQIENISAIPPEIDTVEKLYLWCYYQLSTTNERVEIEGEKEYLVDSELIRPDGVDPRLFLITKINLPIDENWLINGFKLWENALEILEGMIEIPVPPLANVEYSGGDPFWASVIFYMRGDSLQERGAIGISSLNPVNVSLNSTFKKYGDTSLAFVVHYAHVPIANSLINLDLTQCTIEGWLYIDKLSGDDLFSGIPFTWYLYTSNISRFINNTNHATPLKQWFHFAFTLDDGICKWWVNGNLSATKTYNKLATLSTIILGQNKLNGSHYYYNNFKISNMVRYTQNFNPETDTYLAY